MALVFVAHGPTNPATAMNSISSVDVHLVLNGAPQNIRMQPAGAPNTFATNLVIPNPNSASLTFYFTIAAAMNTGPVTCDTAQQTFNGQLTGGGNGAITPSSTGGGDANAPPSQALRGLQPPTVMTIPVVFQPFAAPTGGGSGAPSTPPQNPTEVGNFMDSQRQKLQNDFATNSQSAFSGTTPTGFQPPLQPNSAGNFPAPIFPSAAMSGVGGGACPAIEVNQQVTQQPDGSWNVMFFAGNTKVMGAVLQSIDLVNITLDGAVPTPMSRVNGLVWSFPVKKSLKVRAVFTSLRRITAPNLTVCGCDNAGG